MRERIIRATERSAGHGPRRVENSARAHSVVLLFQAMPRRSDFRLEWRKGAKGA